MSDFGFAVSEEDQSILTATESDKTKLAYSSEYAQLKIKEVISRTLTVNSPGGTSSGSVDNPLDYAPVFMPFISKGDSTTEFVPFTFGVGWEHDPEINNASCYYNPPDDKFYYEVVAFPAANRVYTFKIVVFVDRFI